MKDCYDYARLALANLCAYYNRKQSFCQYDLFYSLKAILMIFIFTKLSQKRIISLWKAPTFL